MTTATEALARAADTARLAPSVHNTQLHVVADGNCANRTRPAGCR
jgi:hypothetical protein